MKNLLKIIAFFCLLVFNIPFCNAQDTPAITDSVKIEPSQINKPLSVKIKDDTYALATEELAGWVIEKSNLNLNRNYSSEIENTDICAYSKSIICTLLVSEKDKTHIQKSSTFFLDTDAVKTYVKTLSQKSDKDPVNATLTMQDGKVSVFSLGQNGIALDHDASVSLLLKHFTEKYQPDSIDLPYDEIKPAISTDSIDNLGVTSLIGEGHSNFRGSPKNRIFNIKAALERFNGTLIKPGEEFSFVSTLGPVDGEHGYLPELVIKNDKTEPEFGGGICQVSTTAFRAAIYSGLQITARRNHAYAVSYYSPHGMDSTIYIPKPDLRFKNNTPGHILIQTEIVGTELIFRFFGTDDGRKTIVDGPHILEKNPDGSMKTTFAQKVTDANGAVILNDVFKSSYESPSKFPHPGSVLTQKPADWSKSRWSKYLKDNKQT